MGFVIIVFKKIEIIEVVYDDCEEWKYWIGSEVLSAGFSLSVDLFCFVVGFVLRIRC